MPPATPLLFEVVIWVVPVAPLINSVRLMVMGVLLLAVVLPSEGCAVVSTTLSWVLSTVSEAVSGAVLKAVVPPLSVVSTSVPGVPLVASHAR